MVAALFGLGGYCISFPGTLNSKKHGGPNSKSGADGGCVGAKLTAYRNSLGRGDKGLQARLVRDELDPGPRHTAEDLVQFVGRAVAGNQLKGAHQGFAAPLLSRAAGEKSPAGCEHALVVPKEAFELIALKKLNQPGTDDEVKRPGRKGLAQQRVALVKLLRADGAGGREFAGPRQQLRVDVHSVILDPRQELWI